MLFSPVAAAAIAAAAWLGASAIASAQLRTLPEDRWCADEGSGGDDGVQHCEVREVVLPASGDLLQVDSRPNGGIDVEGWDRHEVRLRAKVVARADTAEEARVLASQVRIGTQGTVLAEGPVSRRRANWWVSYRLSVPTGARLGLRSTNGGIRLHDVSGEVDFQTVNGGLLVERSAGHLTGRTSNGGVDVRLEGTTWDGEGLDLVTSNGGVKLLVPEGYNAQLETGTVNGGLQLDFPLTVEGQLKRRLTVTLGHGGPPIRAVTTNGGVVLRRP